MKIKKVIGYLRYFNKWRRGGYGSMPHPTKIGNVIDSAISYLEDFSLNEQMLEAGVSELHFEKMRADSIKAVLDEVEVLVQKKTDHNIIEKVIANGKERYNLDTIIHNHFIGK